MALLIKNGLLVTTEGRFRADLLAENGVIASIGERIEPRPGDEVADAAGLMVLPGAIDAHTHLQMDFGNTRSSDSYFSGTRAAACGGTTTVFDFAMQEQGETFPDVVKRRRALCADACVDYAFHVGVVDISGDILSSIPRCVADGVSSFKAYMVYDFGVSDSVLYTLLEHTRRHGALLAVHAENRDVIATLVERFLREGATDPWHHYLSRPELVEGEAVERAIALSRLADAPLYIVHLSGDAGLEAVRRAKRAGLPLYAETCPQYLQFTNDVYKRADGRNFVCSPPIKGSASRDALWRAIADGTLDVVATDHCPFLQSEKDWGIGDFTRIPNGCAGVENMYPYMLGAANEGRLRFERAVALCSTNVARIFGCDDRKGSLTVGKDADIVLYDPSREVVVRNADMHGDNDHTIWEGVRLHGYPAATYSRGRLVYRDGRFVGEKGHGAFVRCKPFTA